MPLKHLSIRRKLTLLLMTISTLGVLLTCLMFYFFISKNYEENYRASLDNLASIVGENCKVALLFDIPEDADTILSSLQMRSSIIMVQLFNKNNELFAVYKRSDESYSVSDHQQLLTNSSDNDHLHIEQTIFLGDKSVAGKLVIVDDMHEIIHFERTSLFITVFVACISIFVSLFLTYLLRGIISAPLYVLTKAVKRLAQNDFSALNNIEVRRLDEIGILSSAFVDMGEKLKASRHELENYSHSLEERVAERTNRLHQTVDDLKKSQAQLIQSEKMAALGVLVAGVAHDINNNINFISSIIPSVAKLTMELSELGLRDTDKDIEALTSATNQLNKEIHVLLQSAEEGVRRTSRIIDDLSTFSRPSSGKFLFVNVHDEIDKILRFLQVDFKHRVTIVKEFSKNLPSAYCLPDQISQVYTNVLLNASQAIKTTGKIHIKTWLEGNMVHVLIRDNGCGIGPEAIERVFDPFFTTKEVGEGSGLGMSVSYSIMKNNNGEILLESKVDVGTDVVIRLPSEMDAL